MGIHANRIHVNIGHPGENRIHTTIKYLYYNSKVVLDICYKWAKYKSNEKFLRKVKEYQDLKPGKMIYLDISSQKKLSCGGSNPFILIQNLDAKQKWSSFIKEKVYLDKTFTPITNKMKM